MASDFVKHGLTYSLAKQYLCNIGIPTVSDDDFRLIDGCPRFQSKFCNVIFVVSHTDL